MTAMPPEHVAEEKVIEARKKGFSIRKIAEITNIPYDTVLEILHRTGYEESDPELEEYMDKTEKQLRKTK